MAGDRSVATLPADESFPESTTTARTGAAFHTIFLRVLIITTTNGLNIDDRPSFAEPIQMIHRGIEFSVTQLMAGVWKWRFQIGDRVFTGKTEAKLDLLAIRRVQLRIDRELNNLGRERTRGSNGD
ncbi:hypothetical protein ACVMIH_002820 [Bradyrhizobium sp. USDA 4503]